MKHPPLCGPTARPRVRPEIQVQRSLFSYGLPHSLTAVGPLVRQKSLNRRTAAIVALHVDVMMTSAGILLVLRNSTPRATYIETLEARGTEEAPLDLHPVTRHDRQMHSWQRRMPRNETISMSLSQPSGVQLGAPHRTVPLSSVVTGTRDGRIPRKD